MRQWVVDIAYESGSGIRKVSESYYMPTEEDVRNEITKKGGYILRIRPHERSPIERLLARSTWWQVQLLRGIQFRSISTSPGVALWKIIQSETNPKRQNILAPAREALARGLGVIEALKALQIFDHGTLAILAGSERANCLQEGIPHAIVSITQKKKNARAIMGTLGWLGFDVFTITQALFWGKPMVLNWFHDNPPTDPEELEKFNRVVGNLELTWNILIFTAIGVGLFMGWCVLSFWLNRGKSDWPTARIVRKIPLVGAYLRDLGFADSMSAASRMIMGKVPIHETLVQSSEATSVPEITDYWLASDKDLSRGVGLGPALDRPPLTRPERLEVAGLYDLSQVAMVLDSIAEMRASAAKTKHGMIVWIAFLLTGVYLLIGLGSSIYALTVMNMSMDSVMGGLMEGAM